MRLPWIAPFSLYSERPKEFASENLVLEKISSETKLSKKQRDGLGWHQKQAKQAEGKNYVGTINRAQQAFHFERNYFARSMNDLDLNLESKYYQIAIAKAKINEAYTTATSKESGLKSYTGTIFYIQSTRKYYTAICETNEPSNIPPSLPWLEGEEIHCPAGSSLLR
jgi:hypothetical protein